MALAALDSGQDLQRTVADHRAAYHRGRRATFRTAIMGVANRSGTIAPRRRAALG
jgi:hypothetical protein